MTTKYTFKQEYPGYSGFATSTPPSTVTMEINGELSLPQVLERFEEFLRGAGFHFDGHLDFVNDEELPQSFNINTDTNMGSTTVTSTVYTMNDTLTMPDRKSTRLNSSHSAKSRMPSSA